MFRMHLTNKEILEKLLSYSDELRQHYELYQFLLFHFQEKNSDHFFSLIEQEIATINPIFQTIFKTFLKDKDKVLNAMELPYSNAKLEATNNLIKVIKRNTFGLRNFENFKKRVLIALNSEKGWGEPFSAYLLEITLYFILSKYRAIIVRYHTYRKE